jgi:hypothetical protein
MQSEPTGTTVDGGAWEEPRPPHLPDRLTSTTPWVLPFLVVAAYQVWLLWVGQPTATDLSHVIDYWFNARYEFGGIAASVLGLALFLRHPDANATLPQVASGAFLLLLAQVLTRIEPLLDPLFMTAMPPADNASLISPLAQGLSLVTSFLWILGLAFLARGLSAARRYGSSGPVRGLAIALAVAAVVSSALSVIGYTAIEYSPSDGPVLWIAGTVLVNLFGGLASAYLFVVCLNGWLGEELPRVGWGLAALGAGLIMVDRMLLPFLGLVPAPEPIMFSIAEGVASGEILGWVLLVVAFVIGLPSTTTTADPPAARTPGSGAG